MSIFPLTTNLTINVIIIIPDLFLTELPWRVCLITLGSFHRTLTLNLNFAHRLYRNTHIDILEITKASSASGRATRASIKCNNSRQKCEE